MADHITTYDVKEVLVQGADPRYVWIRARNKRVYL